MSLFNGKQILDDSIPPSKIIGGVGGTPAPILDLPALLYTLALVASGRYTLGALYRYYRALTFGGVVAAWINNSGTGADETVQLDAWDKSTGANLASVQVTVPHAGGLPQLVHGTFPTPFTTTPNQEVMFTITNVTPAGTGGEPFYTYLDAVGQVFASLFGSGFNFGVTNVATTSGELLLSSNYYAPLPDSGFVVTYPTTSTSSPNTLFPIRGKQVGEP